MAEKKQSNTSESTNLLDLELPSGKGPKPHKTRFLNPDDVAAHFAPLLKNVPSAQERWDKKMQQNQAFEW